MTNNTPDTHETFRGVVYPWHCDGLGHMNTQFYAGMYDAATHHFLSLLCPSRDLKASSLGWADVRQLVEYKKEVLSGDLIVVHSTLLRCGTKSLEYRHALINVESGELHSTSEQVSVLFDLTERKAIKLTDTMITCAEQLKSVPVVQL